MTNCSHVEFDFVDFYEQPEIPVPDHYIKYKERDIPVYELGVPEYESYEVVIHSNSTKYGGTRRIGKKTYKAYKTPMNGFDYSMKLFLDANSVMFLTGIFVHASITAARSSAVRYTS